MGDYTPVYVPSKVGTMTVSTAVSGGDILVVTGSGTVGKNAGANAMNYIGVAASDQPVNGRVSVYMRGLVHESIAEGAVTAGDQLVSSGAAGRQVKTLPPLGGAPGQADVNAARSIMGAALTTAADNQKVRWMEF